MNLWLGQLSQSGREKVYSEFMDFFSPQTTLFIMINDLDMSLACIGIHVLVHADLY